jgi:hypothetical protein
MKSHFRFSATAGLSCCDMSWDLYLGFSSFRSLSHLFDRHRGTLADTAFWRTWLLTYFAVIALISKSPELSFILSDCDLVFQQTCDFATVDPLFFVKLILQLNVKVGWRLLWSDLESFYPWKYSIESSQNQCRRAEALCKTFRARLWTICRNPLCP